MLVAGKTAPKQASDTVMVGKFSNIQKNTYLTSPPTTMNFAEEMRQECGGWGVRIRSKHQYERIKHNCYLTMRNYILCCIEKPDCPKGTVAEVPIKPYHMFPIDSIILGCKEVGVMGNVKITGLVAVGNDKKKKNSEEKEGKKKKLV